MSLNVTLDDSSPLITYVGPWKTTHDDDSWKIRYYNSTYHSSWDNEASVEFAWEGGDITLWGAKRRMHGYYSTSIDNGPKVYGNGYLPESKEEILGVLFASQGLVWGNHSLRLMNEKDHQPPSNSSACGPRVGYSVDVECGMVLDLDRIVYVAQPTSSTTSHSTSIAQSVETGSSSSGSGSSWSAQTITEGAEYGNRIPNVPQTLPLESAMSDAAPRVPRSWCLKGWIAMFVFLLLSRL